MNSDEPLRQYIKLVQRAAACGSLPAGGLTPREQGAVLGGVDGVGAERAARLVELMERCVYQDGASEAQRLDARELCEAIAATLPDPPPILAQRVRSAHWIPWSLVNWALISIGGIAVAVLVLTGLQSCSGSLFSMAQFTPTSVPAVGLEGSRASRAMERRSVAAQQGTDWPSPPTSATWSAIIPPSVLDAEALAERSSVDIDRRTGTDGAVLGNDPFSPSLGWTHRHFVYDTIAPDFTIISSVRLDQRGGGRVFDPAAARVAGGRWPDARETYRATVTVRAMAGVPAPIPSPTPDGLVQSSMPRGVRFVKDANDVLYAVLPTSRTEILVYDVSTRDEYEAAPLPTTPFVARMLPMPENVRAAAREVIDAIGDLPQSTYEATVRRLHAYFAGFAVSPLQPDEWRGNDYLSVALSRKGVCRHRARAFMITATAVGIETRLVENFAHSFCEVRLPNGTWRRMEFRLDDEGVPPNDAAAMRSSVSGSVAERADSVAVVGLLPLALLALAGVLWGRWRDVHGHRIGAAPKSRSAPMRSMGGDGSELCRAVALPLVTFAIDRLREHMGADETENWLERMGDRSVPPMLLTRARTLAVALQSPSDTWTWEDAHSLQRLFWAAWGVLDWIHRQEKR